LTAWASESSHSVVLRLIAAADGGRVDSVGAITPSIVADRGGPRCIVAPDAASLAHRPAAARPPSVRPRALPEVQMPSVLIVDDEQHIRLLIEQALEELEDDGVELMTAPDGQVALDVVRNQAPDLVFLDVTMPKLNGFEACDTIKHELGMTDTFVCMLTAKGQAYDRERGLEAGADLFLTKPFDPDELLAIARRALHLESAAG
jgi:CheY-like chemotaxis protein